MAACSSPHPRPTEADALTCHNQKDDDGNGLVDCHDATCAPFCHSADAGALDGASDAARDAPLHVEGGACTIPLDVVLVLDVSSSMTHELSTIRAGVANLWQTTHALSTDPHVSLVVFVDDVLAVNGVTPSATGTCMPFTSPEDLTAQLMTWEAFCSTNQDPLSHAQNHDCPENSLDAIMAAVNCPTRADATRVIIHVTDDTFAERPAVLSGANGGGVSVQFNYLEATTALMDGRFIVGVFADTGVGDDCGAGRSPDVGRGFSGPFGAMTSLPEATGGHFWDLRQVRAGTIDMASSIDDFLRSVYCH